MKKKLALIILAFCFVFLSVPSAFAANIVTVHPDGSRSIKADAEHLQILNELRGTPISYRELIQKVFPEMLISSKNMEYLNQSLVKWDASSTDKLNGTNDPAQNDITSSDTVSPQIILPIIYSGSSGIANEDPLSYYSQTTTSSACPEIDTLTMLWSFETNKYEGADAEQAYNTTICPAAGSEFVLPGSYRTEGHHNIIFPAGYYMPSVDFSSVSKIIYHS